MGNCPNGMILLFLFTGMAFVKVGQPPIFGQATKRQMTDSVHIYITNITNTAMYGLME